MNDADNVKDVQHQQSLATFQCDDLLEKLKLLNYEKNLLKEFKMKPISRFYFSKSFNPGEQFFMFTIICWWLIKKLGKDMERPQESDDPNVIITRIVQILEEIDIPVDFQPNKLIRGAGACMMVLDCLANHAIKVGKINCQRPQITQEDEVAIEYLEDNAEIILEKLEDEQTTGQSDDSDMEMKVKELNWINRHRDRIDGTQEDPYLIDKLTDQQLWRLECERVLPQLKVFIKTDKDWRSHLNQLSTLKENIAEISDDTQMQLKKLHSEFTFSMDKIDSREKHLNNELQFLIKQFKEISTELSSVQYAQTQVKSDSERILTELNEVIAENDIKKMAMEQRGQSMSDASSVVQIKRAITKLKEDVSHMHLEVALLIHTLDQEILRDASGTANTESIDVPSMVKAF